MIASIALKLATERDCSQRYPIRTQLLEYIADVPEKFYEKVDFLFLIWEEWQSLWGKFLLVGWLDDLFINQIILH